MAARRRKSRKTARRPKAKRKTARAKRPAPAKRSARTRKPPARPRPRPRAKPKPNRRVAAQRPAAPPAERAAAPARLVTGAPIEVGVVLHYYPRAAAAVVALSRPIHRGDTIHVRGQTTDFVQPVRELALDGASVAEGAPEQQIGVRFDQRARAGDRVYRVSW
jgi:hypothetical protein